MCHAQTRTSQKKKDHDELALSPLWIAAHGGHAEVVAMLHVLEAGADAAQTTAEDVAPRAAAATNGHSARAKLLEAEPLPTMMRLQLN